MAIFNSYVKLPEGPEGNFFGGRPLRPPGYGLAVARCQQKLAEIVALLRKHNVTVHFAIHPVAGRMPGHMNVLLAEADVPYDIVKEMDEINAELPTYDVGILEEKYSKRIEFFLGGWRLRYVVGM